MDFNRMMSGQDGFHQHDGGMRGSGFGTSHASQPLPPLTQAFRQAGDAIVQLQRDAPAYQELERKMSDQIQALVRSIESVQAHYQAVAAERDNYSSLLNVAEGRMAEVQRVVQRYTIVQEPVVASDGFTYERRIIKQYLDECLRSGVSPISQQTQGELSSTLVPNQSLKKLVELLRQTKPSNEPPAAPAATTTAAASPNAPPSAPSPKADTVAAKPSSNANEGRLHPCVRVYGYCNYKDTCTYAQYPYDACLSHLKGKCRFGAQCHELHVDFRGPTGARPRKD
jgi:hypothetical protein